MRPRLFGLAAATTVLGACGGGPPAPVALAYTLPAQSMATYTTGDSATFGIDATGQMFQMDVSVASTLGATFSRTTSGVQVSLGVKSFKAVQTNPMGAPVTADVSGISGPLVFALDRRGVATVLAKPQLTGTARTLFQPLEIVHGFFPRLPGRAAHAGDTWTDTISFEGPQGDGTIKSTSIVTYAVVGDTVTGGRRLLKITTDGSSERSMSGNFAGMDYSQKLSGTTKGWVLWDLQRALMVEKYSDGDDAGTMDVSAAPYPLSVHIRSRTRTRLVEDMQRD